MKMRMENNGWRWLLAGAILFMCLYTNAQETLLGMTRTQIEDKLKTSRQEPYCVSAISTRFSAKDMTVYKYRPDDFDSEMYILYYGGLAEIIIMRYDYTEDACRSILYKIMDYSDIETLKVDKNLLYVTKDYVFMFSPRVPYAYVIISKAYKENVTVLEQISDQL